MDKGNRVVPQKLKRRLAAILAVDVVGYSRLMAADEAGTLTRLKALKSEIIDPALTSYDGRMVKLMGDGALLEFASVVDAVGCSVAIQREMAARNVDTPDETRIQLRIGVNLGDVIVEGSDLYGDGVNIAARLEGLAKPGEVYLSGDAYRQARGKVDLEFEDLGDFAVKNIPEPVRVYRAATGARAESISRNTGSSLALPHKPSIAVLPFDNMSQDHDQNYFADGITEDLITALSKIHWFFVIARNSTFTYKGKAVNVTQVGRDLGVRYVLEGSVRKAGNRVRINAQLVDATNGNHVWAENYDRELEDIFALQDELVQTIAGAVEPELSAVERERAMRTPPENFDAWETYQRGLWCMWNFTRERNAEARKLFRQAQELDPQFADAFAFESYAHYLDAILGYAEDPGKSIAEALTAGKKALSLDDRDPVAYFALGRAYMVHGDHDASIAELRKSVALNPSFAQARHGLGMVLALAGQLDEAAEQLNMALRLSPRDPLRFATETILSLTYSLKGEFDVAAEWAQSAIHLPQAAKGGYFPFAALASSLGNLGRIDEAHGAIQGARKQKPDLSLSYVIKIVPAKFPGGMDMYLEGLRKAGLTE